MAGVRSSRADNITAFSGNTRAQNAVGSLSLTLNFAVFDRFLGNSIAGDAFGTGFSGFDSVGAPGNGSPAFDTNARYLYLYQSGSAGPSKAASDDLPVAASLLTSWARWSLFLADDQGIVAATNQLGVDGVPFQHYAPANLGVSSAHVASDPSSANLVAVSFSSTEQGFRGIYAGGLGSGQFGQLFGFTSNSAPTIISDPPNLPATTATGSYVVPTAPEPTSCAVVGLCASCAAFRRRRGVNEKRVVPPNDPRASVHLIVSSALQPGRGRTTSG